MIQAALIGAGAIAPAHIEGLLTFPDKVKIQSIVNRRTERAEALIDRYKLNARAISDYRDALFEADLCIICTPPESHREIAIAAFHAGCHVLLEKPMARSVEDCDAIIEAAEKNGRLLSVVAQSRFITSIAKVMGMIHSGAFGALRFAQVNSFWWRGPSYYDLKWRGQWQYEGGGCTLNHAVHHIDLLLWAKGRPLCVTAHMTNLAHDNSEEEDLSMAILEYADGTYSQLSCSLIHHGEEQQLNFQMERLGISLPFKIQASKARPNGFPEQDDAAIEEGMRAYKETPAPEYEHHTGQIADFLDAIEKGRDPLIRGADGRTALELIMAIYKSASSGEKVYLPLGAHDPFYGREGCLSLTPRFHSKKRSVDGFDDTNITSFKGKF